MILCSLQPAGCVELFSVRGSKQCKVAIRAWRTGAHVELLTRIPSSFSWLFMPSGGSHTQTQPRKTGLKAVAHERDAP